MNKFWKKVEYYNAKLIIPAIVVLLFVIIVELFFHDFTEHYHKLIIVLDTFVILVFVIDLTFLAIRARTTVYFFKQYWLDVIAIFPFVLAMNVLSKLYKVFAASGKFIIGQGIVHEGLEARKGFRTLTRAGRFARWLRVIARSIRVITKSRLFTHVKTKHHLAKRNHRKGVNQRKVEIKKAKLIKSKKRKRRKKITWKK